MVVTPFGIMKFPFLPAGYECKSDLSLLYNTPFTAVYAVLAAVTFIAVRLVQPRKASSSMSVTLSGIVKEPFFPHGYTTNLVLALLYNTPSCELYALLPAATFIAVRLVQPLKTKFSMLVTLFGMLTLVRLVQPSKA